VLLRRSRRTTRWNIAHGRYLAAATDEDADYWRDESDAIHVRLERLAPFVTQDEIDALVLSDGRPEFFWAHFPLPRRMALYGLLNGACRACEGAARTA
jgi:hypothetical protein